MVNPRVYDRRRRSIRNIRKITRTMELIATARFKQAMDRAAAAASYTKRITAIVAKLAAAGLEVSHPLLEPRDEVKHATLLVLSANRGLCGGYNSGIFRLGNERREELSASIPKLTLEVSGKRGIALFKYRKIAADVTYTHFEDKPSFDEVDLLATRYLDSYTSGGLDRLDVVYTKFLTPARQV